MFNLYYINYAKAFEIAMQMDNKILAETIKDHGWSMNGELELGVDDKEVTTSFFKKLLPKLDASLNIGGTKASKATDTIKVVSTKSTVLTPIVKKAVEVKKINDNRIGNLIKIKNVELTVRNTKDILTAKTLMSGMMDKIPVEGYGNVDMSGVIDSFLKGAAYILTGKLPDKVKTEDDKSEIILKIPMQTDNEMESSYCITDIEIGPVTVVGIYRGKYNAKSIQKRIDALSCLGNEEFDLDIETDDNGELETELDDKEMHYIDVIAVIQELNL